MDETMLSYTDYIQSDARRNRHKSWLEQHITVASCFPGYGWGGLRANIQGLQVAPCILGGFPTQMQHLAFPHREYPDYLAGITRNYLTAHRLGDWIPKGDRLTQ